jgi:hypothetical protein
MQERIFAQPKVARRVSAMDGANEPQHDHASAITKNQNERHAFVGWVRREFNERCHPRGGKKDRNAGYAASQLTRPTKINRIKRQLLTMYH